MREIVIYGSRGWIGQQFISLLSDVSYTEGKSRVDNEEEVEKELLEVKPSHVVSFIGRTHGPGCSTIDYLENKLTDNIRDNLYSPLVLAILCAKHNIHFTYLGTGCIFEYNGPGNKFTEADSPNFFGSSYSVVKGFTDRLMHLFPQTLNLRIRMPISDQSHSRDFITKITSYEKICSIPNSMSVLPELLPIALDLILKSKTGTYNLVNPGVISHNEILSLYRDICDPDFTWTNFTIDEQNAILASKRSNNHLDTTKLESEYKVSSIKEAVTSCLKSRANNSQ